MKKEVYNLLTQGNDGRFTISTYETFEKADKALKMHVEAQKDIEGLGGNVYVDDHSFERISIPEFVLRPDAVMAHVTFNALVDGKVIKTERYIIKTELN